MTRNVLPNRRDERRSICLLELKNARRVLILGDVMDSSWEEFFQASFAALLTLKSHGVRVKAL
jgi:hypothetical protein